MKPAIKVSIEAFALTLAFFDLAAVFMKIGPCGPASDSSAAFFVVLLPALFFVDRVASGNSFIAWSIIAVWIYALSWFVSATASWGIRRIKNR